IRARARLEASAAPYARTAPLSGAVARGRAQHGMPRTGDHMIVHHAHGLHVCVADGRADELEATAAQVLAPGIGLAGGRGDLLHVTKAVLDRRTADKVPHVGGKRTELFLHGEEAARVLDRARDLGAVPDDANIREEPGPVALSEARDAHGVEPGE